MASKTISQRITLEGGDDIKKQLEDLGRAGEASFKQIQDAAEKTKIDPARIDQTKQAFNNLSTAGAQLGNQFKALTESVAGFASQGTTSALDVASGLQKTTAAAQQVGSAFVQANQQISTSAESAGAKLISAATAFKLAAAGIVAAVLAITTSLTKGAVESGAALADQAEKLHITTAEWLKLREALVGSSISSDDFAKSLSKISQMAKDAKEGIVQLRDGVTEETKKVGDNIVTIIRMNDTLSDTSKKSSEAAQTLRQLGISWQTILSGNTLEIMRQAAIAINNMKDAAKQAELGVKLFGDNWKEAIKILTSTTKPIDETGKSLSELGKLHRDMSANSANLAKELKKAWEDLSGAIGATKNLIGSLFLGANLTKAKWLTDMVDGATELLRMFLRLNEESKKGFLAGLADTPAATLFKFLIDVGNQLAGLWNDLLVPAGEALVGIVKQIAANFEGVTKSQVAAFFIAAAVAAVALAVAFKGIGLVLSPFTALISLFVGFGPILIPLVALVVLFWDQIKEGAKTAAALIPGALAQIGQSFKLLLSGDFAGFWTQFSEAALTAFDTIKQAILNIPWAAELVATLKDIGKDLPATILLIVAAFLALHKAASLVAPVISRMFGVEITGSGLILLGLLGSMTSAFTALSAVVTILSVSLFALFNALRLVGLLWGFIQAGALAFGASAGAAFVIATSAILAIIAALVLLYSYWPQIKQAAIDAADAIAAKWQELKALFDAWVTTPAGNAWQWIVDSFNEVVSSLNAAIDQAIALITSWVTTPVANAFQWIKDTFNSVLGALGFGGASSSGGGGSGFAGGGLLGGRGSGTSDSNLAWVSRGEYITPARAVSQPGVLAFLEALRRSGGNLRDVLDGMGRFALGGMVQAPLALPAFAGAGMNHVTIQFPGLPAITGLRASSDVVDELHKAAAMAQVRSGGRKPSRFS
jgi:uncharacterized protein Yka (UPF0111/DUF47 family)